jgi:hypothetical protein
MNYMWLNLLLLRIKLVWRAIIHRGNASMIKQLFRSRSRDSFQARSPQRDADADKDAVKSVADAIDLVLAKAQAERAGLQRRIEDVLSRAAIVGGNDTDDYLTRTEDRSEMLRDSDVEIRRGGERLKAIEQNISHFKFLRAALQTRFPDKI